MRSFMCAILFTCLPALAMADSKRTDCLPEDIKGLLIEVEARFGRVDIQSTFRNGEQTSILRLPSKHALCKAIDFTIGDEKKQAAAAKWLMTQPFEVIVYSGRLNYIHLAVGEYKAYRVIGPRATERHIRTTMMASY
jgi:uncharacterized protein YcbK (DUF882 family)